MYKAILIFLPAAVGCWMFAAASWAQCGDGWIAAPNAGMLGIDGYQYATSSVIWDPDGTGPKQSLLILAGGFEVAGRLATNGLVGWDGSEWQELPTLPFGGSVGATLVTVMENRLLVAIWQREPAGGTAMQLYRLDGSTWTPIGTRLASSVSHLICYSGDVFVGTYGGPSSERLMRLTESGWTPAGSGFHDFITAAEVVDGKLVVAGIVGAGSSDGAIREWDGHSWSAIASDQFGIVVDLMEHEGVLYCAGVLNLGPGTRIAARLVEDQWELAADGIGTYSAVLSEYRGSLVIGADRPIGSAFQPPAVWDGADWNTMGQGLRQVGTSVYLSSLVEFNDELVAIGVFQRADSYEVRGLARWEGTRWLPMPGGFSNQVFSLVAHDGTLFAGGIFENIGDVRANAIASWDGIRWSEVAGTPELQDEGVSVIRSNGHELLAGMPGPSDYEVRRWTGSEWIAVGARFNQPISTLHYHDGTWFAGGTFTAVGGQPVKGLVWLDGSVWRELPQVFSSSNGQTWIFALATFEGDLVAGGRFDRAGATLLNGIGRWDGDAWQPFGSGISGGQIFSLAEAYGKLIVGGRFNGAFNGGSLVSSSSAIEWDGNGWTTLDGGLTNAPQPVAAVRALLEFQGGVFAVGDFSGGSGNSLNGIARWDGRHWRPLGSGMTGSDASGVFARNCLVSYANQLWVGSRYFKAGSVVSPYLARWEYPSPTIVWQPANISVALHDAAALECELAGPGNYSTQWFRESSPVVDGITPWGSSISGSQTRALTLTSVRYEDEGSYHCLITSDCGNFTSESAAVDVIPPPCAADVNGDARVDGRDLSTLLSQFGRTVEPRTGADISGDGAVNGIDLSVLLSTYGQSCTN